jgi:hypothetical protein
MAVEVGLLARSRLAGAGWCGARVVRVVECRSDDRLGAAVCERR